MRTETLLLVGVLGLGFFMLSRQQPLVVNSGSGSSSRPQSAGGIVDQFIGAFGSLFNALDGKKSSGDGSSYNV